MSFMMLGQSFPDRIVTNDGDSITCCITLVNDQYIFYYYLKRDIKRPEKINISDVKDYSWTRECTTNIDKTDPDYVPDKDRKQWGYGVKLVQQFNMPVLHTIAAFNVRKGNHNLYVGPHYTYIAEQKIRTDTEVDFSQNTYGINMGYMIVIKTRNEIFDVFMQLDVSLYEADYWYYSGLYSGITSEREFVAENCISVGIKYNFTPKFEIQGGYGIGSTDGFFFMFEEVIPHLYLGFQYNIR